MGEIVNFMFTPGKVAVREPLKAERFTKELYRKLAGDWRHISKDLFCKLLDEAERVQATSVQPSGTSPVVIECDGRDEYEAALRQAVADAADDEGLTAIIANSRSRAKQLAKILAGTAVQQVSDDGRLPSEGVALLDVKLAKGLEFDQVIIPDVQDGAFPDEPIRRHRLYTAISRATKRVTLVANGRLTGLLR